MATTRRFCCNPSLAITSFCPVLNRRLFSLRSTRTPREEDRSQEPATETRCEQLPRAASAGAATRRLALPGLREHAESAGASPQIPQPSRWRRGTEPDHPLRRMPHAHPSSLTSVRGRNLSHLLQVGSLIAWASGK